MSKVTILGFVCCAIPIAFIPNEVLEWISIVLGGLTWLGICMILADMFWDKYDDF